MKPDNWKWGDEWDAVAAAPRSHKVLFENDDMRMLDITLPPNREEPMHTHVYPSVMVVDSPTRIRYFHPDGTSEEFGGELDNDDGFFIEELGPEGLHAVENLDRFRAYHAIRVEWKRG